MGQCHSVGPHQAGVIDERVAGPRRHGLPRGRHGSADVRRLADTAPGFSRCGLVLLTLLMTRLLEEGIEAVRGLPADRQDMAGELLLGLARVVQPGHQLTPEQIADLKIAIAQADRGEFASEDELRAVWKKFGLRSLESHRKLADISKPSPNISLEEVPLHPVLSGSGFAKPCS